MSQVSRTSLLLVLAAAVAACGGGGGGSGGGVVSPSLSASFLPDTPNPGANSVSMAEGAASGDVVTVQVRVTDTNDVYGAAFDVTWNDPSIAQYLGWSPGTLLEEGGNVPNYTVEGSVPGRVVVGAARSGNVSGVDVSGTRVLIALDFRLLRTALTPAVFTANPQLYDSQLQPIAVSWHAGSLQAR